MKHWDGLDTDNAQPARLSPEDAARLAELIAVPARQRKARASLGSMVGLGLAVTFLVGLAWALAPTGPVAAEVRR